MPRYETDSAPADADKTIRREPLRLRVYPDSVLREPCRPVERFDAWLADVFEEMVALMRTHDGIGLAGPQAGLGQRLFVAEVEGRTFCLANPAIGQRLGRDRMVEGCLSLPGTHVEIERDSQIEVVGYGVHGQKQTHVVQGLWARVVQHEVDHLDGVLIRDYQNAGISPEQSATDEGTLE